MKTVLLVDDDPDVQELLTKSLWGAYEVIAVSDWTQVNRHVFRGEVDLILMDVNMPVIRGDKLTEILSSSGQDLNIILFSAMDEAELRRTARAVNAQYLPKTFDRDVLIHKLDRFVRKQARSGA